MIKKTFLTATLVAAMCFVAAPAQAQFGKNLKKIGKAAQKEVTKAAGDMATDMAANNVSAKLAEWMDANNTVSALDSKYSKRVEAIVVNKYMEVDGLALDYKVYENEEMNIIPLANGSIRIYSGMIDALTDAELEAAIASQIVHIQNKDVHDALMTVAKGDNAQDAGGAQVEKMLSMSGDKMGSVINELLQVPYGEDQNRKADKDALTLLKSKKADASGLVSLLEKLAEMEANDEEINNDEDSELELSAAAKFIKVNGNNAVRASLIN